MACKTTFYGIKFPNNIELSEADKHKLAKMLFMSPTTTAKDAYKIINSEKLFTVSSKLITTLEMELSGIEKTENSNDKDEFEEKKSLEELMSEKLLGWREVFSLPTDEELKVIAEELKISKSKKWENAIKTIRSEHFNTPKKVAEHLKKHIVGQDNTIKALSVMVVEHQLRINSNSMLPKTSALLIGNTGTGKSYSVSIVKEIISAPMIRINCGEIVPTGIVGKTISNYLTMLYESCNCSLNETSNGIIHFDEIDKITTHYHTGEEKFKDTIQHEILKFFDINETVSFPSNFRQYADLESIKTNNLMLIFSGAFSGIHDIIYRRLLLANDGRSQLIDIANIMHYCNSQDIQDYGIIPELAGRLSYICPLNSLDEKDMYNIMKKAKDSELSKHQKKFNMLGIKLRFTDDALRCISTMAVREKTGARSLHAIFDNLFKEFYFDSTACKNKELLINRKLIYKMIFSKQQPLIYRAFSQKRDLMEISKEYNINIDLVLDMYNYYFTLK